MSHRLPATEPWSEVAGPRPLPYRLAAILLPWERPDELAALHAALRAEHAPAGATEAHLVEELALLAWRKRRVVEAERALHLASLHDRVHGYHAKGLASRALTCGEVPGDLSPAAAVRTGDRDEAAELDADQAMTTAALRILEEGGRDTYRRALAALHATTRDWWQEQLEEGDVAAGEEPSRPSAASLRRFLEDEVAPWYATTRRQLAAYPQVRRQAWGESLDVPRAQKLQNYDAALDRRFERALGLLLRLQAMRPAAVIPAIGIRRGDSPT